MYILIDPSNDEPFYVGKGATSRMYQHKNDALNPKYSHRPVHRTIQNLIKQGKGIVYEKVPCKNEDHAFLYEQHLIELFGRRDQGTGCLCNLTDGGDGAGGKQSPEVIMRRAESNRGKKRSAETRRKMSEAQKRIVEENLRKYGKKRNPTIEKKRVQKRRGVPWSERARAVKRNRPTARAVQAFRKETDELVGTWGSISLCARELGVDHSAIWKICQGEKWKSLAPDGKHHPLRTHKGYYFKYANDA